MFKAEQLIIIKKVKPITVEKKIPFKENKSVHIIDGLIQWGIYILVFLFPLFFLPFTSEALEINKLIFLAVFSVLLLLLWLGKMFIQSSVKFVRSPLTPAILFFLLVYLVSAIISKDRYQSFIGFGPSIVESFLSIFALVVFYFVVINNIRKIRTIRYLAICLFCSIFLTSLFAFLQLLKIYPLGFLDMTKNPVFNTVGTHNTLGILFGLGIILTTLFFINPKVRLWLKITLGLMGLGLLIFIFLFNFKNIWIGLAIAMALIIGCNLFRREPRLSRWLCLPMVLLGLFVFLYFIPFQAIFKSIPAEVLPSSKATIDIAKATLKENLFLGSGPGTWIIDYAKFKQESVNLTNFWNVRFAKGWSSLSMMPATIGLLGMAAWLSIFLIVIFFGFKNALSLERLISSRGSLQVGIFAGWSYLVVMQGLYHANITLQFMFWFLTALFSILITVQLEKQTSIQRGIKISFNSDSPMASIFSFMFIIIIVSAIIGFYFLGQFYVADMAYARGIKEVQVKGNIAESTILFEKATSLNPHFDLYQRTLSQVYLLSVQQQAAQISLQNLAQVQQFQSLINKMIISVKTATEVSPYNVENWIQRGLVYQALIGSVNDAENWAEKSFEGAIKLDSINPYLYTELARVYFVAAIRDQNKQQEYFTKAETNANEAIRLKADYGPAHILLVFIYERENRVDEAISRMELLKPSLGNDIGLLFRLGYLYYRQNQLDKAQAEFEGAVSLVANFSNARYFLGLIYDRKGNEEAAIDQFERILALNPQNREVMQILANLKNGQPALQGLTPLQISGLPYEKPETKPPQPGL